MLIDPERLALLRAQCAAETSARELRAFLEARHIQAFHDLGRKLAAERYSYEQMRKVSERRHYYEWARTVVPEIEFQTPKEWDAFVTGVQSVLAEL